MAIILAESVGEQPISLELPGPPLGGRAQILKAKELLGKRRNMKIERIIISKDSKEEKTCC